MGKVRWKTDEVVAAIKAVLPDSTVENTGRGGDVDTDNLVVFLPLPNHNRLFVCGFITDGHFGENTSDVDVDMVELSAGEDSKGGLRGVRDVKVALAYGKLRVMLVERGFNVVPCLKDYF